MTKRIQESNNDLYASFGEVTVAETLTTLGQWAVHNDERVYFSFSVTTQNLDQFEIQGRAHYDDSFQVLYNSGFGSPTGILLGTSTDLAVLTAGSSGWFLMEQYGLHEIRVQAAAASAGALVTSYARGH